MTSCTIYRSGKKAETYLYLADELDFADLPAALQESFGIPSVVMKLQLSANRRLARVDVESVLECLAKQGYYLQLPPKLPVEEEIARRFS